MKAVRLGQVLVDDKIITPEQLDLALERQKVAKKRLGVIISEMGFASERDILRALAQRLQVEYVDTPLFQVELDVVKLIPEHLARKYNIVPLNLKSGVLTIATNDPLDFTCLEDLGIITGLDVKTVVSSSSEIDKAINRVYSRRSADEIINDIKDEYGVANTVSMEAADDASMAERVDSAPVVKLVNNLIFDAFQQNASDIHIEPEENITRVRYRIDGDLQLHNEFSSDVHQLIITRIKIISGMNIAEIGRASCRVRV